MSDTPEYDLWLYIAGHTPKSMLALANLRRICDDHLAGRCQVVVIDLREDPQRAASDEILAVPTLVRRRPEPTRKIFGDLSNTERVLVGLGIHPRVAWGDAANGR